MTRRIPERSKIATGKTNNPQHTNAVHDRGMNNDKSFSPDVLLQPDPLHTPLQKQQNEDKLFPTNQGTSINLDIEENSPFQVGVISETIQRPDKPFFQNLKRLEDIIDMGNLIHKFLPKQMDIDKILHIIQRKVLKGTHLPVEIKEIQAGYLHSLHVNKPYITLNTETNITITQQELRSCKKMGNEFYCEELFIVKHKSSYSCESAIYFNLTTDIIRKNSNFNFYYNKTDITPTVLDGGNEIILANWPNDKHII